MPAFNINMASLKNITISTVLIILVMSPCTTPLSFTFTYFTRDDGNLINYEALAYTANDTIQLTVNQRGPIPEGRATYAEPLHLWDRASRNLTDFQTHFSFSINSLNAPAYGDGMVFFLAPNGSKVPEDPVSAGGGNLGLSTYDPFIAVEFDTFKNDWDPPYNHVGIDINSMRSVTYQRWWSNTSIMQGRRQEATIKYTAQTKNLSVVLTYWGNGNWLTQELSYTVDLRDYLPEFVTFGFSASIGVLTSFHTLYSWNFSSNLVPDPSAATRKNSESIARLIGVVVGGLMFVLLVLGLLVYYFWKKRMFCFRNEIQGTQPRVGDHEASRFLESRDETSTLSAICNQVQQDTTPTQFTYDALKEATNNFANENLLGRGGFGSVYKGQLEECNSVIAVKRIYSNSHEGEKGYVAEVKTISRLIHTNLVRLLGWCHENKQELLLVYEFMPNGSLDSHLFYGTSLLNWGLRLQIAKDLAHVLHYLHDLCDQCVLHRDIKSSNIMLDAKFKVKLGDFGLARLVDHEKGSDTTVPAGTFGYMAPELLMEGAKASRETDVYSFGVVALELSTGKKAIHGEEQRVNLVEWARSLYGMEKLHEAADPGLASDQNMGELLRLMTVGLWCAHPNSSLRPLIKEAAHVLDGAPFPVLPSLSMHSSQYVTACSSSSRTMSNGSTESSQRTESFSGASS